MTRTGQSFPKITVAMPAYNAERYISESIESVLRQDFLDLELIVYDDGSKGGSYKIAQKYARQDKRVRVYRSADNRGVAYARNKILALARGEYIAPHDADDIMLAGRLKTPAEFLDKHPDTGVVFGKALIFRNQNRSLIGCKKPSLWIRGKAVIPETSQKVSGFRWFAHGSSMFRRKLAIRVGGYDSSLRVNEDMDLFWRLCSKTEFYFINRFFYAYRLQPHSLTYNQSVSNLQCLQRRYFRVPEKNGKSQPGTYKFLFRFYGWTVNVVTSTPEYLDALRVYLPRVNQNVRATNRPKGKRVTISIEPFQGGSPNNIRIGPVSWRAYKKTGHCYILNRKKKRVETFVDTKRKFSKKDIYEYAFLYSFNHWISSKGEFLIKGKLVFKGRRGVLVICAREKDPLFTAFLNKGFKSNMEVHTSLVLKNQKILGICGSQDKYCHIERCLFPKPKTSGAAFLREMAGEQVLGSLISDPWFSMNWQRNEWKANFNKHMELFTYIARTVQSFEMHYNPASLSETGQLVEALF